MSDSAPTLKADGESRRVGKRRSISRNLTVSLVLAVTVVSAVSIGINYLSASRRSKAHLEDKADEYIALPAGTVEIPLWDIDIEHLKGIGVSYAAGRSHALYRAREARCRSG